MNSDDERSGTESCHKTSVATGVLHQSTYFSNRQCFLERNEARRRIIPIKSHFRRQDPRSEPKKIAPHSIADLQGLFDIAGSAVQLSKFMQRMGNHQRIDALAEQVSACSCDQII